MSGRDEQADTELVRRVSIADKRSAIGGCWPSVVLMGEPAHVHRFVAGADTTGLPLVLLHGSDGSEADLVPLAGQLAPRASRISVRGSVATDGGYAFFRRFPDRRIDEADIGRRVSVLADFITTCCAGYDLPRRPIAVGFSNGAIMTAALLMTHPDLLAGAILFRPMPPFTHGPSCHLDSTPVLIIDGLNDRRRAPGDGLSMAEQLGSFGARITHHALPVGHAITAEDTRIAHDWLGPLRS